MDRELPSDADCQKRLQAEVRDSQRSVLQERIRQLTNS